MGTDRHRREWLRKLGGGAALAIGAPLLARAHGFGGLTALWTEGDVPLIEVWRARDCVCCQNWVSNLKRQSFVVKVFDVPDAAEMRRELKMPDNLAACHTARISGYVIEGHVPARDIQRLLYKHPKALGLAVPGMPIGSPGMEQEARKDPYDVLLVGLDGSTSLFRSIPGGNGS